MKRKNVSRDSRLIAVAASPWRAMLILMFVLMSSSQMMAENPTPVTHIEVGKWYRISNTHYDSELNALFCNGIEQWLDIENYSEKPCCKDWTFEPTDDGFYYIHNSLGAYIADYTKLQDYGTTDILSGTKSEAVKIKVTCEDNRMLLQNMSDSTYLSITSFFSFRSVCWSQTKSSVLVTEVTSSSSTCSALYDTCQLQVGESMLIDNLEHELLQHQWTSNDESIATVNQYGEVTGLKEGDVIVWYSDSINGCSGFTKVTVKNNPCEHEYDPKHDIMAKYVGSGLGLLMSKGYAQFYYDNNYGSFDIYIDGVKFDNKAPVNTTYGGVYVEEMPPTFGLDYAGVHTMIITPTSHPFERLPEEMFYNVYDVESLGNIYFGPNLVELRLPATLTYIGDYNGYGCAYLKDIYYYGTNMSYFSDPSSLKIFCDGAHGDYYYESICGRSALGTKQFHIKSNAVVGVLEQLAYDCNFRVKCIDQPEQTIWVNIDGSHANDSYKIHVGESISVKCFPTYFITKHSVSNPDVLERTDYGYTGEKSGKTTITIWNGDSTQVVKTISVEVNEVELVKVQTVTITPSELTLYTNETATLSVAYAPEDASEKRVTWKSSDNSVAMVSNGVVAGLKEGTCTITATATDGSGAYDECKVTVLVPDGIDNVNNDAATNESWYTLQGVRLSDRPTESGVYICNGKKVVVK